MAKNTANYGNDSIRQLKDEERVPRGRVVTNKTYEYFGLEVLGGENND